MLVVDDEFFIRQFLKEGLEGEAFDVTTAGSTHEALTALSYASFDLVLLDVVLPDGNGLALCERIRLKSSVPIIMLTARGEMSDVIAGLEKGADDYIIKPIELPVVTARIRAQLRRATSLNQPSAEVIRVGELTIDPDARDVMVNGTPARLTTKEFEIISVLAKRAGKVVQKDDILEQIWGLEDERSEKILAVYIRRLRQKLEQNADEPRYLLTVRGFGYKLGVGGQ